MQTQPPFVSGNNKEEIPKEEHLTSTSVPRGKGKAKARPAPPPLQPTRKSTRIPQPSYYVTRLLRGEGTTTGREEEPAHTPSTAERHWYHPDWPGPSTSSTFSVADTSDFFNVEIHLSPVAATKELTQVPTNIVISNSGTPNIIITLPIAPKALLPTSLPALPFRVPPTSAVHQIKRKASPVSPPAPVTSLSTSSPTPLPTMPTPQILVLASQPQLSSHAIGSIPTGLDVEQTPSPTSIKSKGHCYCPHSSEHTTLGTCAADSNTADLTHLAASEETIQSISNKSHDIEQSHGQTPPGHDNEGEYQEQVQLLLKTIDDFKQAEKEWRNSLQHTLTQFDFRVDDTNPDAFYTQDGNDTTMLTIHSDGHFLNGTSQELVTYHQQRLKPIFRLIDSGLAQQSLGIKTIQDLEEGITSHISHIDTILRQITPHHNRAQDQALHKYKPLIDIQSLKIVQA